MGATQACRAGGCCRNWEPRRQELRVERAKVPEWVGTTAPFPLEDAESLSWFAQWDEAGGQVAGIPHQDWWDKLDLGADDDTGAAAISVPQDATFMSQGRLGCRTLQLVALPADGMVLDIDTELPAAGDAIDTALGSPRCAGDTAAAGVLQRLEEDLAREAPPPPLQEREKVEALYHSALRQGEQDNISTSSAQLSGQKRNDLAVFLCRHREPDKAEQLHRLLLRQRSERLGEEHFASCTSGNNLACALLMRSRLLSDASEHGEAEKLLFDATQHARRAVEGMRSLLGRSHEDTLTCLNNLAAILEALGCLDEAEMLYKEAFCWRKVNLGQHHIKTLASATSLACLYETKGRLKEAEKLCQYARQGFQSTLGLDHPTTVTATRNLASVLEAQGKWRASESLYRQVLAECDQRLGQQHLASAQSAHDLASTLHAQGRLVEALPLYARALQVFDEELGYGHPETLGVVFNSAKLLQAAGEDRVAVELFRRELQGCEAAHGASHADTIGSVRNLALLLQRLGQLGEAEKLFRRELAALEEISDTSNDGVLYCLGNLAGTLQQQGQLEEAEALLRRARAGHQVRGSTASEEGRRCTQRLEAVLRERCKSVEADILQGELQAAEDSLLPQAAGGALLAGCTPRSRPSRWEEPSRAPAFLAACTARGKPREDGEVRGLPIGQLYQVPEVTGMDQEVFSGLSPRA